jgi:hypothetical protein
LFVPALKFFLGNRYVKKFVFLTGDLNCLLAVKRLMREAAEMASATADYFATPLEDNLFEWHFTVRGPESTDFEVRGRILTNCKFA